eukprot:5783591-Prymnesium_polylepis.1
MARHTGVEIARGWPTRRPFADRRSCSSQCASRRSTRLAKASLGTSGRGAGSGGRSCGGGSCTPPNPTGRAGVRWGL